MLIKSPPAWNIPERETTPEGIYLNRREMMKGAAAGTMLAASSMIGAGSALAAQPWDDDPSAKLYPVARNEAYTVARGITPEDLNSKYNNFYEFGSHKQIFRAARRLNVRPWTIKIDGMVEKEMEIDIDDLLAKMPLEERIYRHRCVEAWSMTIPWSGFALKALVDLAAPLGSAKYIEMKTFMDPDVASGQKQFWYPWAYTEGLTMAEATNELAFLVTGTYGHPALNQHGAPLRLAVPWKYGFKSIKSIVQFHFTDKRPTSFWEDIAGKEYGFWANVNPDVPHPRWSQATERALGADKRVPTLIYNGYAEQVAGLYKGMESESLFM